MRNPRCATVISWLSAFSRLPSATQAATSSRSTRGTWRVRVVPSSFHVNTAASWIGPASTHRQLGLPHRFVVIVSEPSRNGPIVRSRVRMRWPVGLVREAPGMWKVSILSIPSARKPCGRGAAGGFHAPRRQVRRFSREPRATGAASGTPSAGLSDEFNGRSLSSRQKLARCRSA